MSEADIKTLHGHVATIKKEAARQRAHAKTITEAAQKALNATNRRLDDLTPATAGDEYQQLLADKGTLEQVLAAASR